MLTLEVPLCGAIAAWRSPGSRAFGRWLATQPWAEGGGICSVITESMDSSKYMVTAIRKGAYAENRGQTNLRVISAESGPDFGSPIEVCLGTLGLAWTTGKLRIAEELAQILRIEPILFVITANSDLVEWWETLNDFADIYGKRQAFGPLAIVVIGGVPACEIGPMFDFRHGWPEGMVELWADGMGDSDRWANYLYLRVAWESGGYLTVAEDLERLVSSVSIGDDEAIEKHFNKYALETSCKISATNEDWIRLVKNLGSCGLDLSRDIPSPLPLLWNPPNSITPRIVPWFCRAVLLRKRISDSMAWKFRNELFCEPLRRDLTGICHHGEALVRARIFQSRVKTSVSEESNKLFEAFKTDTRNYHYPSCHPAYPDNPWVFASFGEVMNSSGARLPEQFWSLLAMRNSIAHGHFVGWKHVKTAIDVLRVIR